MGLYTEKQHNLSCVTLTKTNLTFSITKTSAMKSLTVSYCPCDAFLVLQSQRGAWMCRNILTHPLGHRMGAKHQGDPGSLDIASVSGQGGQMEKCLKSVTSLAERSICLRSSWQVSCSAGFSRFWHRFTVSFFFVNFLQTFHSALWIGLSVFVFPTKWL